MAIVLVGGGARSGKSRFALEYAEKRFERRAFLATGEAGDVEMAERIRRHQAARGSRWTTIEEPLDVAGALRRHAGEFDVFVVDCLTLWLSNVLLDRDRDTCREIEALRDCLAEFDKGTVVLITNEVGSGIVPENELARRYRDLAGELNQKAAEIAEEVYWLVFGVPVAVKKRGSPAAGEL